jgi:hypothetical protein
MIAEALEASPAADLPAAFASLPGVFVKDQVAGPLTLAAAGKGELAAQVERHAVERARRILAMGKLPVIAFDEPDWKGDAAPLRPMLASVRSAGAVVGFHCCGAAPWGEVLALAPDFVNPDVSEGAANFVAMYRDALKAHLGGTGWIGWGLVPTLNAPAPARTIFKDFLKAIAPLGDAKVVLRKSYFTPACGLASHTPAQAEDVLRVLFELSRYARVDHLGLPVR